MTAAAARYDGHSQWYDEWASGVDISEEYEVLRQWLGAGRGEICLDVACGTGRYGPVLEAAGYRGVGFDISADQLRFARPRLAAAARANAARLPLRDDAVPVAVGMYFHTDVEDFAAVAREVARVLRPAGRFVYLGLHPCFLGPFVNRVTEVADRSLTFRPGYGSTGWVHRASGDGTGVASRVGFHHKTLASFLGAIAAAGLTIRAVRELAGGGTILPRNIAVAADKPAAS
jgi:SAM-dependent methyltransferase